MANLFWSLSYLPSPMVQIITMPDNNKPWWGKLFAFSECTTSGPAMDPHGPLYGDCLASWY